MIIELINAGISVFHIVIVSIITSTVTYFFVIRKMRTTFNHRLVESLYEKRFETYKDLIEITQELGKTNTSFLEHKKARESMVDWQKKSGGYLLFTKNTLDKFNILKRLLKKGEATKDGFNAQTMHDIFVARNALRGSLRKEFDLLHVAEISI